MFRAQMNSGMLHRCGLAAFSLLLVLATKPAWATNCSYNLAISEDLGMLDPSVPTITSTTSAEWVYLRSHPYLEITNTSDPTSGVTLTGLTIQLYNTTAGLNENLLPFGAYPLDPQPGIDPGTGLPSTTLPSITSFTSTPYNPSTLLHSSVNLTFANLLPGGSVIFRLDLDPVNPKKDSSFADYRKVFFTVSNATTPSTQNATSTVDFHSPNTEDPDPIVAGPNRWHNLPIALAGNTSFGIAYSCLNSPDTVIPLDGTTVTGSNPQVPEPSTLLLATLGIAGVYFGRSRLKMN
jgi:PEP-CTERM motif